MQTRTERLDGLAAGLGCSPLQHDALALIPVSLTHCQARGQAGTSLQDPPPPTPPALLAAPPLSVPLCSSYLIPVGMTVLLYSWAAANLQMPTGPLHALDR